ncbi:hypothetical protein A5819_000090 [Enterococcus sp. 7E2_DIV0204]|uniref:hypothetical protein n=1 Tax=unclassified Enterococcus TaxID=2608891 RepID=UPI000A3568FD|nr:MULTISPECIES: hypothetical protein [unclassified Enterococcus]OTN87644.1 hypothetical protein A5819_000090 [Enterococcus sp. 7E2_DIV0204]OTP49675.1 hypothetical protein A5884_002875 [Enterococcus sp. 7D2_DIV0200]
MKLISTFKFSKTAFLSMYIVENAEQLSYFSEVEIYYTNLELQLLLFKDYLGEGIKTLQTILQKTLNQELYINEKLLLNGLGYEYMIYLKNISDDNFTVEDNTAQYLLWETVTSYDKSNCSWLYNKNDAVIFEVTPLYKYFYEENVEINSFDTFLEKYESYAVEFLTIDQCKKWLNKLNYLIKEISTV